MAPESKRILVVGAGAWGTALAIVLANNGLQVKLWGRDSERQQRMHAARENELYLPGIKFPGGITAVSDVTDIVDWVVMAVPCSALRSVLQYLRDKISPAASICLTCKGLEHGSLSMVQQVASEVLPDNNIVLLSGPSFASEVAIGKPTGVALAAPGREVAEQWVSMFHNNMFRVYTNDDLVGVSIAGAVKNVIAIATGIADELQFGTNSRAMLITRGLAEMSRIGLALGGKMETFLGLAGVGDLVLTCTDDESRNRRLGRLLVSHNNVEAARRELGATSEGAYCAVSLYPMAQRFGVDMPISEQVLAILQGTISPAAAITRLLDRPPKTECL